MINRSFICIFCGEKKRDGMRFRSGCGLCGKCDIIIPRTPKFGTFAGNENIKYIISPLFYKDSVRDAIMRYKFEGWSGAADVFTYIVLNHILDFPHLKHFDAVIPVPLSKQRYNERGFNQSESIARAVAKGVGLKCDTKSLIKIRNSSRQSRLSPIERIENVKGAYSASDVPYERIILVDDIFTTGATMSECARTLLNAGVSEVIAFALSLTYKKEKSVFSRY